MARLGRRTPIRPHLSRLGPTLYDSGGVTGTATTAQGSQSIDAVAVESFVGVGSTGQGSQVIGATGSETISGDGATGQGSQTVDAGEYAVVGSGTTGQGSQGVTGAGSVAAPIAGDGQTAQGSQSSNAEGLASQAVTGTCETGQGSQSCVGAQEAGSRSSYAGHGRKKVGRDPLTAEDVQKAWETQDAVRNWLDDIERRTQTKPQEPDKPKPDGAEPAQETVRAPKKPVPRAPKSTVVQAAAGVSSDQGRQARKQAIERTRELVAEASSIDTDDLMLLAAAILADEDL